MSFFNKLKGATVSVPHTNSAASRTNEGENVQDIGSFLNAPLRCCGLRNNIS